MYPPPPKRGILWTWVFLQKERIFPGAHKIGAAISGPRIADTNFTECTFQFFFGGFSGGPKNTKNTKSAKYIFFFNCFLCFSRFSGKMLPCPPPPKKKHEDRRGVSGVPDCRSRIGQKFLYFDPLLTYSQGRPETYFRTYFWPAWIFWGSRGLWADKANEHSPEREGGETANICFFFGAGQMGSYANGVGPMQPDFNRILTGFYLLGPARVRPAPSKTHDSRDFYRILTGL